MGEASAVKGLTATTFTVKKKVHEGGYAPLTALPEEREGRRRAWPVVSPSLLALFSLFSLLSFLSSSLSLFALFTHGGTISGLCDMYMGMRCVCGAHLPCAEVAPGAYRQPRSPAPPPYLSLSGAAARGGPSSHAPCSPSSSHSLSSSLSSSVSGSEYVPAPPPPPAVPCNRVEP